MTSWASACVHQREQQGMDEGPASLPSLPPEAWTRGPACCHRPPVRAPCTWSVAPVARLGRIRKLRLPRKPGRYAHLGSKEGVVDHLSEFWGDRRVKKKREPAVRAAGSKGASHHLKPGKAWLPWPRKRPRPSPTRERISTTRCSCPHVSESRTPSNSPPNAAHGQ